MTAQKLRNATGIAHAVTQIVARIGAKRAADAIGKSESLVYKWQDPDRGEMPNAEQMLALDLAYAEAAGPDTTDGNPPCYEWLRDAIERGRLLHAGKIEAPLSQLARITSDVGELAAEIAADVHDGDLSPLERARIAERATVGINHLHALVDTVAPREAVPRRR